MIFYYKDNKVYSSVVRFSDDNFVEITKEEYDKKMNNAICGREQGVLVKSESIVDFEGEQW